MSKQTKIRRPVMVDGAKRWISASTEQEYAEKCARMLQGKAAEVRKTETDGRHNFREYAYRWFEVFSRSGIAAVTAMTYERQLRLHICPVLGDRNVEEITSFDVQMVFNRMGNASKETKVKTKLVLHMILEHAVEEELLRRNPLCSRSIRITGAGSQPTVPYRVDQMRYLVQHLEDVSHAQDRAWLELQALHPLRLEETLGLQGQDVDEHWIHVRRAVTHPERNRPVVKETKTAVSMRDLEPVGQIRDYLPVTAPRAFILGGDKPLTYQQVRRMCERIQRDTGFDEKITPIRFRTTVLTDLYDQTKDLKQTQQAAGHANAATTMKHYVKGRTEHANTAAAIATVYGVR